MFTFIFVVCCWSGELKLCPIPSWVDGLYTAMSAGEADRETSISKCVKWRVQLYRHCMMSQCVTSLPSYLLMVFGLQHSLTQLRVLYSSNGRLHTHSQRRSFLFLSSPQLWASVLSSINNNSRRRKPTGAAGAKATFFKIDVWDIAVCNFYRSFYWSPAWQINRKENKLNCTYKTLLKIKLLLVSLEVIRSLSSGYNLEACTVLPGESFFLFVSKNSSIHSCSLSKRKEKLKPFFGNYENAVNLLFFHFHF